AARVYLSMRKYEEALDCADKCLGIYNTLVDYNTIDSNRSPVFLNFHPAIIYHSEMYPAIGPSTSKVDSVIIDQYDANDLRISILFNRTSGDSHSFVGSYAGSTYESTYFSGIATDEVYLMRAECFIRLGLVKEGIGDINRLLVNRYKTGTYEYIEPLNQKDALDLVLRERDRKSVV